MDGEGLFYIINSYTYEKVGFPSYKIHSLISHFYAVENQYDPNTFKQ